MILKGTTKLHHLDTMKLSCGILSDDLLMSTSKNYKNLTRVELASKYYYICYILLSCY